MANTIGWGKATQNNTNGYGKYQNTIGAASVYAVSAAGETVIEGTSAAFSYSASSYHQDESDPTPTITGTSGGTFSATPSGLSINASTGTIDLDNSTIQSYTITYTVSGVSANQTLAVTASPFIANAYSMDFDGVNDYITTGYSLTGSNLSLSYWVKADGTYPTFQWYSPATMRASNNSINQSVGAFYRVSTNLYPALQAYDSAGANFSAYTARGLGDFGALGWKHIAYTYDNTTKHVYLYVDGVQQSWTIWGGTSASTDFLTLDSAITLSELWIGAFYSGNYFGGKIDEVAVWNTKLSSGAITEIYNATNNNSGKVLDLSTNTGNYTNSSSLQYWNRLGD